MFVFVYALDEITKDVRYYMTIHIDLTQSSLHAHTSKPAPCFDSYINNLY